MIQIISVDNNKENNNIELIRPIIGILNEENTKKCFFINENIKEEYFIDFIIEDETQSLILECNNILQNVEFSQTVKYKSLSQGKFCLKKLYSKVKKVNFAFTVYIPDSNDAYSYWDSSGFVRNKSFLGILYNGYLYKKIIKESENQNSYYPSEYNGQILYFYLYLIKGVIKLENYITNNFPLNKEDKKDDDDYFELININNIGNEYFGSILIKNNELNSSPMDANKNIFLVKCDSGVTFIDEVTNYCEYNIMFYTENDLIKLRINEKFSYLNYDKIKLKMQLATNVKRNKLIIDLYTYYDFSYINILNTDKYSSSLNTFYNGHLITNEIVLNKNEMENNDLEIILYDLEVASYDYDYVSISVIGNNNEEDLLENRFWFNDYTL